MFTYIKTRNYKSLGEFELNLINKKKQAKKLAIIYGENGAGKSNIATIFYTLADLLRTMSIRDILQDLLQERKEDKRPEEITIQEEFIEMVRAGFKDIETIINDNKTIDSMENMIIEFGFQLDGDNGNYIIEMNNSRIVREELNFIIEKNRGNYFKITDNEIKTNDKIFNNKSYQDELLEEIKKYWGKHSLLSILINDIQEKADGYVKKQVSNNFNRVISFLNGFCCKVKVGNRNERGKIGIKYKVFKNLYSGKIPLKDKENLIKTEELLNEFFTRLYSDVKEVYYKINENENNIEYKLFCKKLITNKIVNIDFKLESTGTQQLLDLIPYILEATEGNVVIIDEFDAGIHDLLASNLVMCINECIEGQLILTTHNTMLMESNIDKDSLYFLVVDNNGIKRALTINDYDDRVHPNNNLRNKYLKGVYGGIPYTMEINFQELIDILE